MAEKQPKLNDKLSWQKIGNTLMFFTGWTSLLFWLFNYPMRPDPYLVQQGRHMVHVAPTVLPEPMSDFAIMFLHQGLAMIALVFVSLALKNFFVWKWDAEAKAAKRSSDSLPVDRGSSKIPTRIERPKPQPYLRGPRDSGPFNPPPWPQLVMAGIGLAFMLTAAAVGVPHEWIGQVYVRGPSAFLCVSGLMFAFGFVASSVDEARARGEWES